MMTTFSSWVKRHPLVAYFTLAYTVSWLLLSPLVARGVGLISLPFLPGWNALGALGPILAAFTITSITEGKKGVMSLLARMGRWRVGAFWFLLAAGSPFVLFGLAVVLLHLLGAPWPDFSRIAAQTYGPLAWLIDGLFARAIYGLGEEPGWRGFALPRLQQRRSAFAATCLLAVFWAGFHLPFFLYRFEFRSNPVQIVGFFVALFCGAIWLTYLYNKTGSVLMTIFWHTGWNVVVAFAMVVAVPGLLALLNAGVVIAAAVVLLVWREGYKTHARKKSGENRPQSSMETSTDGEQIMAHAFQR